MAQQPRQGISDSSNFFLQELTFQRPQTIFFENAVGPDYNFEEGAIIKINNIEFKLIKKRHSDNYLLVNIISKFLHSVNKKFVTHNFWVYGSNSELGLWRYCTTVEGEGILYKGNFSSSNGYEFDYVQSTLIHLKLQEFITVNLELLIDEGFKEPPICASTSDENFSIIDSPNRQIKEEPFIDFQQFLKCGERVTINPLLEYEEGMIEYNGNLVPNNPKSLIREFSNEFRKSHKIVEGSVKIVICHYFFNFQDRINVVGSINKVELARHILEPDPDEPGHDTNFVTLYYFDVKLTNSSESLEDQYSRNIQNVCSLDYHFAPFLLTTPDVVCNYMGLYDKYIPCGSYICKLFDYSSEFILQCTDEEIAQGKCSPIYSYVGKRYDGIFPFDYILELKKAECSRVSPYANPPQIVRRHSIGGRKKKRKTRRTKRLRRSRKRHSF